MDTVKINIIDCIEKYVSEKYPYIKLTRTLSDALKLWWVTKNGIRREVYLAGDDNSHIVSVLSNSSYGDGYNPFRVPDMQQYVANMRRIPKELDFCDENVWSVLDLLFNDFSWGDML